MKFFDMVCHAPKRSAVGLFAPLTTLVAVTAKSDRSMGAQHVARRTAAVGAGAVLLALLASLWTATAQATDAPHNAATLPNNCEDCHVAHSAAGAALTQASGVANLCMSCHNGTGMAKAVPVASADQAVVGTSGNSHRWDATAVSPLYGASTPSNPGMSSRLVGGALTCDTCHDPHSQANAPADPGSPTTAGQAGRHFQRVANNTNAMCVNCHSAWNTAAASTGTYYTGATSTFNSTSAGVTLSSTAGLAPGMMLKRQADAAAAFTTILSINNGTTLTLVSPYKGTTGTGAWDGAAMLSHPVSVSLPSANTSFFYPPNDAYETGTATAGSTTTVTDTTKAWVASSLVGQWIMLTSGTNATTRRQITANTATQVTFAALPASVAVGDAYRVERDQAARKIGTGTTGGSTTALVDSTQTFTGTLGMWVRVTGPMGNANRFLARQITVVNSATQVTVSPAFPATLVGCTYEVDWDGNTSNNMVLDNAGTPSYTQGNIVCQSCHDVHYADSNASTYSSGAGAGDGRLLRRANDGESCEGCHNLRIHNSTNTSSKRAAWGTTFTCRTCHAPHQTTNIWLVSQTLNGEGVDFRAMTTGQEPFGLVNGPSSGAIPTTGSGPCEVCHTDTRNGGEVTGATSSFTAGNTAVTLSSTTGLAANWEIKRTGDPATAWTKIASITNGTTLVLATGGYKGTTGTGTWQAANPRFRTTGSGRGAAGTEHYVTMCTGCHKHETGFGAAESGGAQDCSPCHNDIWQGMTGGVSKVAKHTLGSTVGVNDDSNDTNVTWGNPLSSVAAGSRSCVNMCHGDHPHDLTSPATSTHDNNVYANASSQANRAAATRTSATRSGTDFDSTLASGGLCISCHTNPVDATHPAIGLAGFTASEHNYVQNSVGASTYTWTYTQHDGSTFDRNCTKCHADRNDGDPNDATFPFGAVHYSDYPSLLAGTTNPNNTPGTFVCYNCHGNGTDGVNMSGKDIATLASSRLSEHPMNASADHDTVGEYNGASFGNNLGGKARHANCLDCHDPHEAKASSDSGTATSVTATTLVDTAKAGRWKANEWQNYKLFIVSGTGNGQVQTITGNDAAGTLTVASWNAAAGTPVAGSTYRIDSTGSDAAQGATTGVWGVTVAPTTGYGTGTATFVDNLGTVYSGASGGVVTTASTGTTVTSATRNWVTNQWATYTMRVVTGAQANQVRTISANTQTALTIGTAITLAAGDVFVIYKNASAGTPVWTSSMVGGYIRNELDRDGRWYRITAFGQPTAGESFFTLTITPNYCSQGGGGCTVISDTKMTSGTTAPTSQWQMDHGTSYSITQASYTKTASVTKEHEICLKCHSNFAFGDSPPNVPSGHQDGSAVVETAVANDFNSLQLAYHPIFTKGQNQPTAATNAGWNLNAAFTRYDNTGNSSTFGLSNTFTTGWFKESLVKCSDCHASDSASDPLGPHGSGKKWVLRGLDPNVCWTRRNSGGTAWEKICNSQVPSTVTTEAKNFCLNCHRWDVYGYIGLGGDAPGWTLSRVAHDVTGNNNTYNAGKVPRSGIVCQNCHGGDRIGGVHGTNRRKFPYKYDPSTSTSTTFTAVPGSYSGKRMLNGAYWYGVTRATTTTGVACWGKAGTDTVSLCAHGHQNVGGNTANYSYDDAADP